MLSWRYGGRKQPRPGLLPVFERCSGRCSLAPAAKDEGFVAQRLGTPHEGWNLHVSVFSRIEISKIILMCGSNFSEDRAGSVSGTEMQVGTPIERKRDRSEDNVQTAEQQRRASPARCRGLSRVGVVAKLSRVRDVAGCRESFLDFASCREQAEPRGRRGRREGPGVARNRAQRQTGCVTRRRRRV